MLTAVQLELPELAEPHNPLDALHRAERLRVGYLKTEPVMREHGIRHTIVVFGGTRLGEGRRFSTDDATDYYQIARDFGRFSGRSTTVS